MTDLAASHATSAQVLKGLLDAVVLQALSKQDSYGFEIFQNITEKMQDDADLFQETTLYPLLHRLEAKQFVESYWKPGNRGTDRKYYMITELGSKHLKERTEDWSKVVRILKRTIHSQAEGETK